MADEVEGDSETESNPGSVHHKDPFSHMDIDTPGMPHLYRQYYNSKPLQISSFFLNQHPGRFSTKHTQNLHQE